LARNHCLQVRGGSNGLNEASKQETGLKDALIESTTKEKKKKKKKKKKMKKKKKKKK